MLADGRGRSWLLHGSRRILSAPGLDDLEDQRAQDHQARQSQTDGGIERDLAEDREGVGLVEQALERLALEERVGGPLLLGGLRRQLRLDRRISRRRGRRPIGNRLAAPVAIRMALPDLAQMQPDELLRIGVRLLTGEDLLAAYCLRLSGRPEAASLGKEICCGAS